MRYLKWYATIENVAAYIGAGTLIVIMVLVCIEVFGRYLRLILISGTFELVELLLGAGGALTLAYVQRVGAHVGIEFFTERLPPKKLAWVTLITLGIMFVLFSLLTWRAWVGGFSSWQQGETVMGAVSWPTAPFKLMLVIGLGMIAVRSLIQIKETIAFLMGKKARLDIN